MVQQLLYATTGWHVKGLVASSSFKIGVCTVIFSETDWSTIGDARKGSGVSISAEVCRCSSIRVQQVVKFVVFGQSWTLSANSVEDKVDGSLVSELDSWSAITAKTAGHENCVGDDVLSVY